MTTFDIIGGIQLTMAAAIVIAALSIVFGYDSARRIRLAAILAAWFVTVVILGATRVLHDQQGIRSAGLGLAVTLPVITMFLALLRIPSLRKRLDDAPLTMLVGVHILRILGISFLILQASSRLPAPFAPVAGAGDIFVGLAAIPITWLIYRNSANSRPLLIAWNVLGLLDLVAAVSLGVASSPGPLRVIQAAPGAGLMSLLPWLLIPGFLVPLLATIHLAIFYRLARPADSYSSLHQSGEVGSARN